MSDADTTSPASTPEAEAQAERRRARTTAELGLDRRFEVFEAIILAIATVLTAWSAFQATKWSGSQANSYSEAGGQRTTAGIAATEASALTVIDVQLYLQWLAAINAEELANPGSGIDDDDTDGTYEPTPGTLSGFLSERFRDEFKPAFNAWLAQDPLNNPDAADTPFALPRYKVEADERSKSLVKEADESAANARSANQTSDNYVLLTVLFASVLFFGGMSAKMSMLRSRLLLISMALLMMAIGSVLLISFPHLV